MRSTSTTLTIIDERCERYGNEKPGPSWSYRDRGLFARIHPGEILKSEFLDQLDLTAYAFSQAIGMNRSGVSDIINGERAITAETALRFARFFSNSPQFWLNLQDEYNLRIANRRVGRQIAKDVTPFREVSIST